MLSMTNLPWRTKKTKADFRISVLNFIGGGIYFLGEKLGLFYVGKGPLNGPSEEGEKNLKYIVLMFMSSLYTIMLA